MEQKQVSPVSPWVWKEKASKAYHMTIKDVLNLPVNKPIKIFFLDRNCFDPSCEVNNNPVNKPINPVHFFRKGYFITFTRKEGIKGRWEWNFEGCGETDIEDSREFHIDLGHCWFPLSNNTIPKKDPQGCCNIGENAGKHYSEMPETTRLGWRGQMILVSDMEKCPDIMYTRDGYTD